MLLEKLLDPNEALRRRRIRARIIYKNRIKREVSKGNKPRLRAKRPPKDDDFTLPIHEDARPMDFEERVRESLSLVTSKKATGTYRTIDDGNLDASAAIYESVTGINRDGRDISLEQVQMDEMLLEVKNDKRRVDMPETQIASASVKNKLPFEKKPSVLEKREVNESVQKQWMNVFRGIMIEKHRSVLAKTPDRRWRQQRLGLLLYRTEHYYEAYQHLRKAIELGDDSTITWRRFAQSSMKLYLVDEEEHWGKLWDAKSTYEWILRHVECMLNPYILLEYEQVIEKVGGFKLAMQICGTLMTAFTSFQRKQYVQLRFVILHKYYMCQNKHQDFDVETILRKCVSILETFLLDDSFTKSNQYVMILYLHARVAELLHVHLQTNRDKASRNIQYHQISRHSFEEVYKLICHHKVDALSLPDDGKSFAYWRKSSDAFLNLSEYFSKVLKEPLVAADAIYFARELKKNKDEPEILLSLARNAYDCNQMESAIKYMEKAHEYCPLLEEARESLCAWFPEKWKDRLDLEDACQVHIARAFRGYWDRKKASHRYRTQLQEAQRDYDQYIMNLKARRDLLRLAPHVYKPLFDIQNEAAVRIQKQAAQYLQYARIRWKMMEEEEKTINAYKAKYKTLKYRYNQNVRKQLIRIVPEEYQKRFLREEIAAHTIQRWYRGERVRVDYRFMHRQHRLQLQEEINASVVLHSFFQYVKQRQFSRDRIRVFIREAKFLVQLVERQYCVFKFRVAIDGHIQAKKKRRALKQQEAALIRKSATSIQRAWRKHHGCTSQCDLFTSQSSSNFAHDMLERLHRDEMREQEELEIARKERQRIAATCLQSQLKGWYTRCLMRGVCSDLISTFEPRASRITAFMAKCEDRMSLLLSDMYSEEDRKMYLIRHFGVLLIESGLTIAQLDTILRPPTPRLSALVIRSTVVNDPLYSSLLSILETQVEIKVLAFQHVQFHLAKGAFSRLVRLFTTKLFGLEQLLFEDVNCGDPGQAWTDVVDAVGDYFFGRYGKLHTLSLSSLGLQDSVMQSVSSMLTTNHVLTSLDLSCNAIGDTGAMVLAQGVRANTFLRCLDLSSNHIQSRGAKAIVSSGHSLQTIDLGNNFILRDLVPFLTMSPPTIMMDANLVVANVSARICGTGEKAVLPTPLSPTRWLQKQSNRTSKEAIKWPRKRNKKPPAILPVHIR